MKIDKSCLAVPLILALCVLVSPLPDGSRGSLHGEQQVQFLTAFYKDYLSRPRVGMDFRLAPGSFYSKGAEALMAANDDACKMLSRGDEICGYGADGDVFLNTQEIAPDLNFEKSQLKAVRAGENTVDVSFNVWPDYGEDYHRTLRYLLVKEAAGWRVDDVFWQVDGAFPASAAMRYQINQENERVLAQARNVFEVLRWIFTYLSQQDMLDRIERSVAFPVRICDNSGSCQAVLKGDLKLQRTLGDLHRAYYKGDSDDTTDWSALFPKEDPERVLEGKTVRIDALELTFQGKAWWITTIDLRALGQTILGRRREPHY